MAKVRALEKVRDEGRTPKPGSRWTVTQWLEHWLENVARPSVRVRSFEAYQVAVNKHLIPGVGKHRLDRLEPEHLEVLYRTMVTRGSKPATAHQVHRTVRTALGEAVRRGHVARNVAELARPPRVRPEPVEPFNLTEVRAILAASDADGYGARWALALALGLRQGEALGLHWADVDLDRGLLTIRRTRARPRFAHGCSSNCGKTPGYCPQRVQVNADIGETKSDAGRRTIGLPEELVAILTRHRETQAVQRDAARQLWEDGDWVFTDPTGRPVNPVTDHHRWKALLRRAGVREARLHDARHTAATVLLVLGVPERTAMGIMGWSTTAMAARYQHVTDPIRATVARQVGGLLWDAGRGAQYAN
jgi:integrase